MGIVVRQGFWNLLLNYGGVAIGYLNKIVLFTAFLSREQFGIVELLLTFMVIGSEVSRLGINKLIIRFFPYFREGPKEGAFVAFTAMYALVGAGLAVALLTGFMPFFARAYAAESPLFVQYLFWTPILVAIFSAYNFANSYAQANLFTVVPTLIWQVLLRLFQTGAVLAYAFLQADFEVFVALFVASHLASLLLLAGYVLWQRRLSWSWKMAALPRRFRRLMAGYGGFSTLADATSVLLDKIDIAMIGLLIGEAEAGAYAVAFYIAILIQMPARAMNSVLIPLVSRRAKEKNWAEIGMLYKKSSLNNLIVGGLFYVVILLCLEPFFELAPKHSSGKYAVAILGAAMLANIGTSINRIILINSRFFRSDFGANLALLALAVFSNLVLIPRFGITGAAAATFLSIFAINTWLTWMVYHRFGIHPFSANTVKVLGLLTAASLITWCLPAPEGPLLAVVWRAVIASVLVGAPVMMLRLSPELNGVWMGILRKSGLWK